PPPRPAEPPRRPPAAAAPAAPPRPPRVPPSRPPGPRARRRHPAYDAPIDITARLRPVGELPGPRPAGPWPPPPEHPAGTAGLPPHPVRTRRPIRTAAALACAVLGLGLIGGAATGSWLTGDSSADTATHTAYTEGRTLWHSLPVDVFFPRTLNGKGAGPGGADRVWTRIAVAPDGDCATSLDPLLARALEPVGCGRVLRATYTDATSSHVTTVGMVFTKGDIAAMRALKARFTTEGLAKRPDLMPRALRGPGTVAEHFGDRQRASWSISVLTDAPVVVFAVSGFADGRAVADPRPAAEARAKGATSAPAQSGLGHEAGGVAEGIEQALRGGLSTAMETSR
ncbi:hypothetical protein, partial [Streptomyces amakusaensis]|uniref:hypothetical protein n=1 Tax=Streptomyces amakusaensis TaxID=67271 RepID=UPI003CD0857A